MVRLLTIVSCVVLFAIVTLGDDPSAHVAATAPSGSQPTTEAASGGPDAFMHQEYTFTDPPTGWVIIRTSNDEAIQFGNEKLGGLIYISLEPKEMPVNGMGPQLAKAIRDQRTQAKVDVVMPAQLEKDKRFDIKIHEQYKRENKIGDQIHLYRSVGPRVIYVISACSSEDAQVKDDVRKTAEDLFAAMKFDRKAFLKQKQAEQHQH